jgi:hypothetical protein
VASELARKGADMFLRSWQSFGLAPESYDSLTGEAAGERHHAAGPLVALPAVEEFLDFTPHEGFRFGILKPDAKGRLARVLVQGRHYEVEASGSATVLREEGEALMSVDGGAVVRRFLYNESEVSFAIKTLKRREVRLRLLKKGSTSSSSTAARPTSSRAARGSSPCPRGTTPSSSSCSRTWSATARKEDDDHGGMHETRFPQGRGRRGRGRPRPRRDRG